MRLGTHTRSRRALSLAASALLLAGVVTTQTRAVATEAPVEAHGTLSVPTGPDGFPVSCGATSSAGFVVPSVTAGAVFSLSADGGGWRDDFDLKFYDSMASCVAGAKPLSYHNHAGDERSLVPAGATMAVVVLASGAPPASFTYRERAELPSGFQAVRNPAERQPTVVAVIEPRGAINDTDTPNGVVPYHGDFLGSRHPWGTFDGIDPDAIDFTADPSTYLPGYPGATAIDLNLSEDDNTLVSDLYNADADKWQAMQASSSAAPHIYRFPGTKVIAATVFGTSTSPGSGSVFPTAAFNDAHANQAASVAVGNTHGTCPECLLVVVLYDSGQADAAITWVASQRWIDVVTNSWGGAGNVYPFAGVPEITRAATDLGQTWVWAAGNGVDSQLHVAGQTYLSPYPGPDWHVTVGGTSPLNDQSMGSDRPVDIAAPAHMYPSAGMKTVGGAYVFTGTSNASPVTAGAYAKIVQLGRDLVGDHPDARQPGDVAAGTAFPCALAGTACPLDDGRLTRSEAQDVLYGNVLPSPPRPMTHSAVGAYPQPANEYVFMPRTVAPTGQAMLSQGHGFLAARTDLHRWTAEQRQFLDVLRGAEANLSRPPGEQAWMTADSLCRQRIWGSWSGGYYHEGMSPVFDSTTDQLAMAAYNACLPLPHEGDEPPSVDFPQMPEDVCLPMAPDPSVPDCVPVDWSRLTRAEDSINRAIATVWNDLHDVPGSL